MKLMTCLLSLPGDAVLNKLVLKQSALDDLNLPVKTVSGQIGNFLPKSGKFVVFILLIFSLPR